MNFSYLMYFQHAIHVQLISWLSILWCWVLSSLVINLPKDVCAIFYYNSRDGEVFFGLFPLYFCPLFVHFVANMIQFYHSVLCRKKSSKISISVNKALLRESSKASKPVHVELYSHGELSETVWLWLCCSERDGSKVSLSHASCSACVHVAAPWAAAALLPLTSLES